MYKEPRSISKEKGIDEREKRDRQRNRELQSLKEWGEI